MARKWYSISFSTMVKIILTSVIVGFILAKTEIEPASLWHWFRVQVLLLMESLKGATLWGLPYFLAGAGIVVPIFLLRRLYEAWKNRQSTSK